MSQTALSPQPPQTTARTQRAYTAAKGPLITQHRARPTSARTPPSPRPSSAGPGQMHGSRPQSAIPVHDSSKLRAEDSEIVPQEAFVNQDPTYVDDDPDRLQTETIQLPSAEETGR